jgi:hypothetical protein
VQIAAGVQAARRLEWVDFDLPPSGAPDRPRQLTSISRGCALEACRMHLTQPEERH